MAEASNFKADAEGITITRVFNASREEVWREWTEPERFADWFGGPQAEIPLDTVTMDVTVGGSWRATMLYGGREIHWKGIYREVAEPERLVVTMTDQPESDDGDADVVTVVLTDLGDGRTEMFFTQRGGGLTAEGYERAGQGWGGFFDRMDERLAEA